MVPSYQNLSTVIPSYLPLSIDTAFHPVQENSTDFVKCVPLEENKFMVIAGDVSGCDPKSVQVAAEFYKIVEKIQYEGMTPYMACKSFNEFLTTEWNHGNGENLSTLITSLAASFITFDLDSNVIQLLSSGFPSPALYTKHHEPLLNLGNASMPMGWFAPFEPYAHSTSFPKETGLLYLWSNGLLNHATKLDIHPLTLAFLLLQQKESGTPITLRNQLDDILLIKISWPKETPPFRTYPLFQANYSGNNKDNIDLFQDAWKKSIKAVLPNLHKEKLNKILLCAREAILNAMSHGCSHQNYLFSAFQMSITANKKTIFLRIQDEGTGFNPNAPKQRTYYAPDDHVPLGLVIIKNLASFLEYTHNGSCLILTFHIDQL